MLVKEKRILNSYYHWLCDLAGVSVEGYNYHLLFKELHNKKFEWFIPNDDNRAYEGKNLRERFCDEEGLNFDFISFDDDVSMLELILGLAFRCDWILADNPDNITISGWFWKILGNIRLDKFDDFGFYEQGGPSEIDKILEKIIKRTYSRTGEGGLFPLKKAKKDQRKVELWYQMCGYLVENYYINERFV